jgi:hypothetical protein
MPRHSAFLCAAFLGTALLLNGCNHQQKTKLEITNLPADYAQITTVDVNITSASGTVELIARPGLKAPWIDVKRARPSNGEMKGPGKHPEQYSTATFSDDHGHGTLTIVSTAGDVASAGEWVRILVYVPSLNNVRIRNAGGHVTVLNARGSVDIQNTTTSLGVGSIDFASTFPMKSSLQCATDEGEIDLKLVSQSDLTIEAFAGGSQPLVTATNTALISVVQKGESWNGVLNGGTGRAILRSGKGAVKLYIGTKD